MTNIDPQAFAGPKTSLTKFGSMAQPRTNDGAFLAFMSANMAGATPDAVMAQALPDQENAQTLVSPLPLDEEITAPTLPAADVGDGLVDLGFPAPNTAPVENSDWAPAQQGGRMVLSPPGDDSFYTTPESPELAISTPSVPVDGALIQTEAAPNQPKRQALPVSDEGLQMTDSPSHPDIGQMPPAAPSQTAQIGTGDAPIRTASPTTPAIDQATRSAPWLEASSENALPARAGGNLTSLGTIAADPPQSETAQAPVQSASRTAHPQGAGRDALGTVSTTAQKPSLNIAPDAKQFVASPGVEGSLESRLVGAEMPIAPTSAQAPILNDPPKEQVPSVAVLPQPFQQTPNVAAPTDWPKAPPTVQTVQPMMPSPVRMAPHLLGQAAGSDTPNLVTAAPPPPAKPAPLGQALQAPQNVVSLTTPKPPEIVSVVAKPATPLAMEQSTVHVAPTLPLISNSEIQTRPDVAPAAPAQTLIETAQRPAIGAESVLIAQPAQTAPAAVWSLPQQAADMLRPGTGDAAPLPHRPNLPYADRANVAPQPTAAIAMLPSKPAENDPAADPFTAAQRPVGEAVALTPAQHAAPTTQAPPSAPVAHHQPIPVSAVATFIKDQAAPGKAKTIELTLAPEELGHVRLILQPDGDKMRIVVQAERPETLELLRRNAESFSAELRQSGFANASFSFGGWGESPSKPAKKQKDDGVPRSAAAQSIDTPSPISTPRIKTGLDLRV